MCTKNLTKPSAVLFDLDGTLLDTAQDLGESLNQVLAELKRPLKTFDEYRPVASHGAIGLLKLGLGVDFDLFDQPTVQTLRNKLLAAYESNISRYTQLFEGIEACINELDSQHIPWGIVTNKPAFLTDKLITFHPTLHSSKINISGDSLAVKKPDPTPLLYACEKINVDPNLCWYIGDAQRDIEAGNRANMISMVANWGYTQDPMPVSQWQADYILEDANQLAQLIAQYKTPEQS